MILRYKRYIDRCTITETNSLLVRPFAAKDIALIYQWRNHPTVRSQSLDDKPIRYDDHKAWCMKKLNSDNTVFLIGENSEKHAIGVVRFEIEIQTALINIYIDPSRHGQKYGSLLLNQSIGYLHKNSNVTLLIAEVKDTNLASKKLFERCGFMCCQQESQGV